MEFRAMLAISFICTGVLTVPTQVSAQQRVLGEVGVSLCSVSFTGSGTDWSAAVDLPGRGIPWRHRVDTHDPRPINLYVSIFPLRTIMVEPRIRLQDDGSESWFHIGGQVAYLPHPEKQNSLFFAMNYIYFAWKQYGVLNRDMRLGASVGSRWKMGELLMGRFEVGYNRWLDYRYSVLGVNLAVGITIKRGN
jgi:hypothetical protein